MANLKTKYWIEANDIKTNLPKQHDTGMFRSLDDIIRDVLKCCGIDCCEGIYPGSGVGTNLGYIAFPTKGTVTSSTGTSTDVPVVNAINAGLATTTMFINSHVPVTTVAGSVIIAQSGTDNQTLKADITGIDTATIGQIPSTDGAGNVVWVAQTPSQNIYNSDGTLTGNRTVDQNGNSLIINTTYAGSGLETHIEQSNNIAGIGGEGVGFWTENTDGYLSALYASGGIAVNSSQNAANTQFSRTLNMAGIGYQFAGMSVSDGTTQNDFNVNTTDITVSQYPNTRDDSGITTPTNVLYTDASGKFLSAPVSSIVSADNGLYVTGGITKLGGQLIEDTVIVGELDKSITIAIADAALTEINKLQITNAGVNLKSEGAAETSEIILNDGELSLRGETILKVITNGTPTSPNGSVLTLIDNLTGEAEWQPAGGSSVTVTDSNTIDLTVTGSDITGSVKLDTANGGLTATTNGLLFNADGINTYDNTTSGITATTVQDAIDEVASSFWKLTGNAGTTAGTNFVGTTDAQDLVLKTNNVEIARFKQQGNTTIGSDLTSIDALYISPLSSNPGDMAFQSGQATGIMSTAFGASSATAPGSMAWGVGYKNGISPLASGNSSTAWGDETSAAGRFSTCFGFQNTANADNSTCFGQENTNNANYATVFGFQNTAEGTLSTVFGSANTVDIGGNAATIWGTGNLVSNTYGTAWGQDNFASGRLSTVFGKSSRAEALHSLASGFNNVASGDNSVVFGAYNNSVSYAEMVLGHYSTFYIPISITTINTADRLLTVGNGTDNLTKNNALTMWKDGRSMWNGDVAKQNTWIGVNGTNAQNFINVTTPTGSLAAISTEHTTSGNYAVLGSNAGNSGLVINNTKQFQFTTTAGTTSTALGATTTVANYSNTGFLFGGGGVANSTVDINGTLGLSNTRISTANPILTVNNSVYHFTSGTTGTVNMTAMVVDNRTFILTNYSGVSLTLSNTVRTGSATTTTTLTDNTSMTIAYDGVEFFKIA